MGKESKSPLKLPKSFTQADLLRAIEQTAKTAAREAVKAVEEMNRRDAKRSDPAKAAQRMLSEYRRLKIAQREDIQISEAEGVEMRWRYLEDLMGAPDRRMITEETAYARERKLQYNAYKLQRIEAAVSMYRKECENSGSEEAMRRYRVIKARYMDEAEQSAEAIAETENVSVRSVYNDVSVACKAVAVYLSAV